MNTGNIDITNALRRAAVFYRICVGILTALWGLIGTCFTYDAFGTPPLMTRDDIVCRGHSGVGFSY